MYLDFCEGYTQLRHLGQIEEAANHDFPVLIVGESGTGKEYVARSIHRRWVAEKKRMLPAPKAGKPDFRDIFVVVNCAGLSAELARSELFGHVAGSFTGATDHRLGAVLRACGCKGFKSAKKSLDDVRADSEAYKSFECLLVEIAKLDELGNDTEKVQRIKDNIKPQLEKILISDFRSLLAFFRSIYSQLNAALSGGDLVNDYWRKLLGTNSEVFYEIKTQDEVVEELGVQFKSKWPVGTLFLDEFGDLPPEVQNLLLRFLEEKSGEIQPFGYPGRIIGLKIRLILATSDPRIAKFAGFDLLGTYRSDQELKRSLRHDLLFRVKGQVVKAEAIETQEQLLKSLDEMIDRHSNYEWTPDAKTYLAGASGEIAKILAALQTARKKQTTAEERSPDTMVFGQRRELKRIIDLANAYLESAERRGLRLESNEVTKAIIRGIWRPSELLMTKPIEQSQRGTPDGISRHHPSKDELTVGGKDALSKILAILGGKEELLSAEVFRKHVQGLNNAEGKELGQKIANAVGLDKSGKNEKVEKYRIIGQIFKYGGKSSSQPSNAKEYGKQTGEWWRTQVFKPKK
jgi:MoxR-like ATPase